MCKSQNMGKRGERLGIKKQAILLALLDLMTFPPWEIMGKHVKTVLKRRKRCSATHVKELASSFRPHTLHLNKGIKTQAITLNLKHKEN
jgi:hypothetical protein